MNENWGNLIKKVEAIFQKLPATQYAGKYFKRKIYDEEGEKEPENNAFCALIRLG